MAVTIATQCETLAQKGMENTYLFSKNQTLQDKFYKAEGEVYSLTRQVEKLMSENRTLQARLDQGTSGELRNALEKVRYLEQDLSCMEAKMREAVLAPYNGNQGAFLKATVEKHFKENPSSYKIPAIKEVRELLHLSLKESKDLVDECMSNTTKEEISTN